MAASRRLFLKLEGRAVDRGSISFRLLAGILNGVQDTFYYIALAELGKEPRLRARIPMEIQQACELRRIEERAGSYEVVAEVVDPPQGALFPDSDLGQIVLKKYLRLVGYLTDESGIEQVGFLFPDSSHRKRILRSVESYCPKEGDEWELIVSGGAATRPSGALTKHARRRINRSLIDREVDTRTITGELVRLHLDEHKLGIYYIPTGRVLDCIYEPDLEDFVIQNLRGVLQVTGRVQLDAAGHPEKIIDVTEIVELDLSPADITKVTSSEVTLVLSRPLHLVPVLQGQELVIELPEFNLIAQGATRDEVIRDLESDLVWLWQEYGTAKEEDLSEDAQRLKDALNAMVREVRHGSPPA